MWSVGYRCGVWDMVLAIDRWWRCVVVVVVNVVVVVTSGGGGGDMW